MRHQEIDVLFVEDVGSGQGVRLLVGELYQHCALQRLGRLRAATAQTINSVMPGAHGLLVSLQKTT